VDTDIPGFFRRFHREWNRERYGGNYELYCCEFSYNTIYGNLKTNNLPAMMELLQISQLPNIMFLIRVDDLCGVYGTSPEFDALPHKMDIVCALREYLSKTGIPNVVSTLLGRDTIGAYLWLDGRSVTDADARRNVEAVAEALIRHVLEATQESISIGISDFCGSHAHFPQAYTECKAALAQNFWAGKGSCSVFEKQKPVVSSARADVTKKYFTGLVAAINKSDREACRGFFRDLMDKFRQLNLSVTGIRLQSVGLVGRLVDYYAESGMEEESLYLIAHTAIVGLLNCSFSDNARAILDTACKRLCDLQSSVSLNAERRFKQYVDNCIEKYSADYSFGLAYAAAYSNYSPSYFSRLFAKVYGMPFSAYLASYRVEKAKKLLWQEALSMQEISMKAGFRSTSYFCSVFKSKTGMSPRQYFAEEKRKAGQRDGAEGAGDAAADADGAAHADGADGAGAEYADDLDRPGGMDEVCGDADEGRGGAPAAGPEDWEA
jgi:AraC-like DNA-binding protein